MYVVERAASFRERAGSYRRENSSRSIGKSDSMRQPDEIVISPIGNPESVLSVSESKLRTP